MPDTKTVLEKLSEVRETSWPSANKGDPKISKFDLFISMGSNHCATCQCANAVMYSGFTLKYVQGDYREFHEMRNEDRVKYCKEHPEELTRD